MSLNRSQIELLGCFKEAIQIDGRKRDMSEGMGFRQGIFGVISRTNHLSSATQEVGV